MQKKGEWEINQNILENLQKFIKLSSKKYINKLIENVLP